MDQKLREAELLEEVNEQVLLEMEQEFLAGLMFLWDMWEAKEPVTPKECLKSVFLKSVFLKGNLKMEPTKKSEEMEQILQNVVGFDRREFISQNLCVPPPIGCGNPTEGFYSLESSREYTISGLCQKCQDELFG